MGAPILSVSFAARLKKAAPSFKVSRLNAGIRLFTDTRPSSRPIAIRRGAHS